ncbi:DUF6371 domain-containing protein [Chlorobium sp.]|uniref:DUF6371 domain-containing protein n=1 Tax=Chlorobium sp. TaxID=1095 RepID=UPI0025C20345|nr:DUF6371 domain-containing protein [Chlorobium sp.]
MFEYRYHLERSGSKHICPACQQRRFVRYVDTVTGEQIADDVGRCDREDSCGYHLRPSEYLRQAGARPPAAPRRKGPILEPEPSLIDAEMANKSLRNYNENNFAWWLASVFGIEKAFELVDAYHVGTSKHWPGASIFWQQDVAGRIRSGKIMLYNAETGRRVKEPFNHTNWVHKVLNIEPFHLKQCLFGEHLLIREEKPVALVESEKTAIVAAGFIPEYSWLALGGKRGNTDKTREALRVLRNRKVTLFPDLGAFDKWSEIAKGMPGFTVSDILERRATDTDRAAGLDLADYLLMENRQALSA